MEMPVKNCLTPGGDLEGYAYPELLPLVEATLGAGISVMLRGHPGVGKSSLAAEVTRRMALPIVDIRLAQRDPAELAGVYFPDRELKVLSLFPPEWVQQACQEPVLVFLDEINAAVTRLHQAAAYQIVLERRVGPFAFHPGTRVLAAGNLEEDNAIVSSLSSALCNRFAHYTLRVDARAWLRWGARVGLSEAVLAYVGNAGEEALYDNNGDHAFPTPRSWEMASRMYVATPPELQRQAVAACVGPGAAERLFSFTRILGRIKPERIIHKGQAMDFTRGKKAEPSFVYAAVFAVAGWLNQHASELGADELANIVAFLRSPGLHPELVFLCLRQLRPTSGLRQQLGGVPGYRELAGELVSLQTEFYQ